MILYLGSGFIYVVDECIAFEHYTVERYVTFNVEIYVLSGGGGHRDRLSYLMPRVDIYLFKPYSGSSEMKWMKTFASSLADSSRANDWQQSLRFYYLSNIRTNMPPYFIR